MGKDVIGFVKFKGKNVEEGYLDAKTSAEILIGFDESIRFFLQQEAPSLQEYSFEIPVSIRKGSWETVLPDLFDTVIVKGGAIWFANKYLGPALEQMAQNDFENIGFKDLFKNAFKSLQNVLKLTKHLKRNDKKDFERVRFRDNNEFVGIENEKGEVIWIPKNTLEHYKSFPKSSFSKIASQIEDNQELIIGVNENGNILEESISIDDKQLFTSKKEEEILFPELEHGDYVELEGHLSRGNESSNTVGFLYKNHILTCFPERGNIKIYKSTLFSNCKIKGFIYRVDKEGNYFEKRPKVRFIDIVSLEDSGAENDLFQ